MWVNLLVTEQTNQWIDELAREQRRTRSAIVDLAVECTREGKILHMDYKGESRGLADAARERAKARAEVKRQDS